MHLGGFELTKLTYTRLEDNLIRHWDDRLQYILLGGVFFNYKILNDHPMCHPGHAVYHPPTVYHPG